MFKKIKNWFVAFKYTKGFKISITISITLMLSLSIFLPIILLSTPDTNSINAYKRDSSSSATILFEEKALDTKENDNYSSNILEADSTSGMLTRVENDINSIGYAGLLSVYDYNNDKMLSDELSMLALNGISPTKENIENEEYGLVRQNNIFLKMEKQDFIQIENDIENGTIVSNDEEVLAWFFFKYVIESTEAAERLQLPYSNEQEPRISWIDLEEDETYRKWWTQQNVANNKHIEINGSSSQVNAVGEMWDGHDDGEVSANSFVGIISEWDEYFEFGTIILDMENSNPSTEKNGAHIGFQSRDPRNHEFDPPGDGDSADDDWKYSGIADVRATGAYMPYENDALAIIVNSDNSIYSDYETFDDELNITTSILRKIYYNGQNYDWSDVSFDLI